MTIFEKICFALIVISHSVTLYMLLMMYFKVWKELAYLKTRIERNNDNKK